MGYLITGGSGYVGKQLVEFMQKSGETVYRVSRADFDLKELRPIQDFFKGKQIDRVIHLASAVETADLSAYYQSNIAGLYLLLTACAEHGVAHFTFASSNNVYPDNQRTAHTEDERMEPNAANLYGISKYVGELMVSDFCQNRGIVFANVRIGDIYGPGQRYGNLVKAIAKGIKDHTPLKCYGAGLRTRDYIYSTDVVKGLAFISDSALAGTFNLATGQGTSVSQLLDLAVSISEGACVIDEVVCEQEDKSCVILNVDRLKKKGFAPEVSIEEGLRNIVQEDLK